MDNFADSYIHFDIEQLKSRLRNNEVALTQILSLIKSNLNQPTTKLIDEMKTYIETADLNSLRIVAHKLKGTAQSSCCPRLAELAKSIQDQAYFDKNLLTKAIEDIFAEVELLKKQFSQ